MPSPVFLFMFLQGVFPPGTYSSLGLPDDWYREYLVTAATSAYRVAQPLQLCWHLLHQSVLSCDVNLCSMGLEPTATAARWSCAVTMVSSFQGC